MGNVAAVYGCILSEEANSLKADAKYYTFRNRKVVFASDHFEAEQIEGFKNAVPILENSVLLFNVDESSLTIQEYAQKGTIVKRGDEYLYVNEVHLQSEEFLVIYCLLLPEGYYPRGFYSGNPHYAGMKGSNILITWFFREHITIKIWIVKDADRARSYTYIENLTFAERYPKLQKLYDEAKDFATSIVSKMISPGQ